MPLIQASHIRHKALSSPAEEHGVHALWLYVLQVLSVGVFFGIGLVVCPVCWLISKITFGKCPSWTGQAVVHGLFRFYRWWLGMVGLFEVEIENPEAFRSLQGVIIAANHPSLLDAIYILSLVPRAVCVMRADLMRNPMIGGAALLAGYVTNDSGPALIRQSMRKIGQGENLLIFPEGTRTRSGAVNPFKKGFAYIATHTEAPVQTVFIERFGTFLAKGGSMFGSATFPSRATIRLGAVIHPETGETPRELSARLESYFEEHLENTGKDVRIRKLPGK